MQKIWYWVLLKNPAGLACLVTAWGFGAAYALAGFTGLLGGVNIPLVLKFSGIAGLAIFVAVPVLQRIFRGE